MCIWFEWDFINEYLFFVKEKFYFDIFFNSVFKRNGDSTSIFYLRIFFKFMINVVWLIVYFWYIEVDMSYVEDIDIFVIKIVSMYV